MAKKTSNVEYFCVNLEYDNEFGRGVTPNDAYENYTECHGAPNLRCVTFFKAVPIPVVMTIKEVVEETPDEG